VTQKMAIVGGYGEMGRWFERFFKQRGFEVTPVGRSSHVHYGDYDIVLLAVPIDVTREVIARVAPQLRPGALLFDITSVKRQPVSQMLASAPLNVELVSVHPLFGPSMPDMEGETIIVTPVRGVTGRQFLTDLFECAGAHVEELSPEEHDHLMSVVQGLTHFGYIAMGTTLEALNFDIKRSRRFMSPVYEILIDFVGRILGQNPRLYAAIQMNTDRSVHEAFLTQSAALIDSINARDTETFVKTMKRAARHFGDAEPALKRSNKLIMANIKEVADFKRSIGCMRGIRNVYTGAVHIGVIKRVSQSGVVLEEGSREITLKTENVQLMSDDEVRCHRLTRGERHRDFSVVLPEGANPETVARLLTTVPDVTHIAVVDCYPQRRSHTFRVSTYADGNAEELQREVISVLLGIGCVLR